MSKNTRVSARLRVLRKREKFTQEGLAGASGVALRTIQDIETGNGSPSLATMEALAGALSVPVERLISEAELPQPDPRLELIRLVLAMSDREALGFLKTLSAPDFSFDGIDESENRPRKGRRR